MTGIFVLDQAPDPEALRQRMAGITRLFPALRSRIVESVSQLGRPRLTEDPDFDITLHVAHYVMPAPGSWDQVLQHARRYSLTDLDRDRALWRVVQLDGLRGGRSVVILVVHHAIADGQGLVKIISGLLDAEQSTVAAAPPKAPRAHRVRRADPPAETRGSVDSGGSWPAHAVARMPRRAHAIAAKPSRVAGGMLRMAGSARRSGMVHLAPLSSLLAGRCTTYTALTLDVGFGSLRAFAKQHGGTINDAFLTGLTAGFRRYHEAMGAPAGRLRINVPVSFRSESSQADDNTQAIARIVLDAGEPDTGARFSAVQQAVAAAIREPVLTHMDLVAEASRLLPIEAIVAMSRGQRVSSPKR